MFLLVRVCLTPKRGFLGAISHMKQQQQQHHIRRVHCSSSILRQLEVQMPQDGWILYLPKVGRFPLKFLQIETQNPDPKPPVLDVQSIFMLLPNKVQHVAVLLLTLCTSCGPPWHSPLGLKWPPQLIWKKNQIWDLGTHRNNQSPHPPWTPMRTPHLLQESLMSPNSWT